MGLGDLFTLAAAEPAAPPAVVFQPSARAKNYRLTLRKDGVAVAVIPPRGSRREAEKFVQRHQEWLERARARQARRPRGAEVWVPGTSVLWRGEMTEIRVAAVPPPDGPARARTLLSLGADVFRLPLIQGDLRPALEGQFVHRAKVELPARAWELAAQTRADLKHVTVRNQRSRWGSCSANGTVSLNWRLIQSPEFVRDYIIYHELAHLWEMNHSHRFWLRVEEICPGWREAERWIKRNGSLVGF